MFSETGAFGLVKFAQGYAKTNPLKTLRLLHKNINLPEKKLSVNN
jgi:hypothetical protein